MKRERVFELAKGYRGKAKNAFRVAHQQVMGALQNQYSDRKVRKREMRSLWIERINAGAREHGLKYGDFIHGMALANMEVDRKVLADLAVTEPISFKDIVLTSKEALMAKYAQPAMEALGAREAALAAGERPPPRPMSAANAGRAAAAAAKVQMAIARKAAIAAEMRGGV